MLIREAKSLLRRAGYRLIKEETGDDLYLEITNVLIGRGYDEDSAANWIAQNDSYIKDLIDRGNTAEDIVYALDGDLDKPYDDETEEIDLEGDRWEDVEDFDESCCSKKGKKKGCCGKKGCKDCDDEDDELDESIEDIEDRMIKAGVARKAKEQEGTSDWSDFKDNFRAKTLLLKKALTPRFVSELIKKNDFEIDDKDIKAYAMNVIENANLDAKDPVGALQAKIRRHFPGM